jgi:hypothetical protein
MSTTLREALAARIDQVGPAHPDLDELVGLGERRLRRRRIAVVVASGAAVILVIALAIGGAAMINYAKHDNGPVDHPIHPTRAPVRPLVYSDDVDNYHVGTIHVGDQLVDIDQGLSTRGGWDLALTDAGVVYNKHSLWFTDGGAPRRISECGGKPSGSSGTWATWIDCAGDLVVFDTGSGQEVARKPLPSCLDEGWWCETDDVVGKRVYFTREGGASGLRERHYRFDVSTGLVVAATDQMYADDIRSHSPGLVFGRSWRTGTATDEGIFFDVVGSRLVPTYWDSGLPTEAFDEATGSPVRLSLPDGITPPQDPVAGSQGFILFEALDDNTIALVQRYERSLNHLQVLGDIITCHLSNGRCRLAVPAGPPDQIRLVPGMSYPA